MLIKCPECKKEISDKSEICIHCGYPISKNLSSISKNLSNICIIDDVPRDLTELIDNLGGSRQQSLRKLVKEYNMKLEDAVTLCDIIQNTKNVPKEYKPCERELYISKLNENSPKKEINVPKCPTCGSTNIQKISGLERGASVMGIGIFSKKINKSFKCKSCGYTW